MTLVSHQSAFIFLKTHKTASTSVEVALEPLCAPPGATDGAHYRNELVTAEGVIGARGPASETATWRNHLSARAVRKLVGRRIWRRYAKITTVRNPYPRMVSMFYSRQTRRTRAELAAASFDEVRADYRLWLAANYPSKNMNKLVLGGRYVIDHVMYYETLEEDFAALSSALGSPTRELPRLKAGRNPRPEPWRDYYDNEAKRLVARGSGFELAFFGYSFERDAPDPPRGLGRGLALLGRAPRCATNMFAGPLKSLTPLDAAEDTA